VKPAPFGYYTPATVDEALDVLSQTEGKVLAGGQSLIPILNMRLAEPPDLVDINRLDELSYISNENGEIRIGALARHSEVERDAETAGRLPLLRQALRLVAHPVIRNRGTVVGSLVHADPAAELPAVLALLGGSATLARRGGAPRTVPASDFFLGPLESATKPGELAVSASFPIPAGQVGTDVTEVSRRHGDFALAGVATLVAAGAGGVVERARVACFGVGPIPVVVDVTEAVRGVARGTSPGNGWSAAVDLVRAAVDPDDDIHATAAYRRHLVGVLAARSFRTALSRAQAASADDTRGEQQ
jgi:aerobic carbon-monoxide dehydrogenase medium subunit